jgi:hypothetical protein
MIEDFEWFMVLRGREEQMRWIDTKTHRKKREDFACLLVDERYILLLCEHVSMSFVPGGGVVTCTGY